MPNLMNIISPRQCGIVKERNKSRNIGKSSSSQTSFSLANTLFSFTQTFENIEVGKDDNRDDSSVNVDSDVDLFSTMNAGRELSPRRKLKLLSHQKSYDNNKVLKFDGCGGTTTAVDNNGRRMKSPKKCFRACGGSGTDESSIGDHPRRSLSNRSMDIERARSPSISLGVVNGSFIFSSENDIEESHSFDGIVERKKPFSATFAVEGSFNFPAENDIEEAHSFEGSVERKKRFSSAFILSRNDSIDSGAVSSSASFQSKGTNVTLSDLYSKETNTLDTGTISASTSFQSKDTNITASDFYSKETCTENYDSSDSQSGSKSTLTSKETMILNPNAKFHFDRFFSKESYTDTYDTSDSQSESMTASSDEDDDDYSLDRSKSSSYSDKTESSDTCTEHDDNSLGSESEISNHSRVLAKTAKYSNRYLFESKNLESLGGSETSSSSGSLTSFDNTLKDRYTHEEDLVLACRSPRDFNAAIDDKTSQGGNKTSSSRGIPTSSDDTVNDRYVQHEDTVLACRSPRDFKSVVDDETETIQEDDSRLVVRLPNSLHNDVSQRQRSTFTTSKIALAKADCLVVSLADDTTEISISNLASLCSDVIRYDSNIENVRTDELYEPEDGSLNHATYNNGLHSDTSLKENFTRFLFDGAAIPPATALHGYQSRADSSIAVSPDAAAYGSGSRVDNFIGSCENAAPPKQDFLPNNIKELNDFPPLPPAYDATFLAIQQELDLTAPQGKSNSGEDSLSQHSLATPSHTACNPNSTVNITNNHTSEASADLFKQERCQLHDGEDTEQLLFNDAVASLSLPGIDSTSNHTKTGMNLNDSSPDYEPLLLPSTVAFSPNELKHGMNRSEKDFDSASLLSYSDNTTPSDHMKTGCHPNNTVSITNNHTSEASDALCKQERCRHHDVRDIETVIDVAASSLPLPLITSTSNHLKIAMDNNDKAPDYEPLLLPSTVSFSSNKFNNDKNLNQEDLDSSSLLPPPDNASPTNHLETGTFLMDDDSSFFTALVEPNLSIDTDNNDVTAAAFKNEIKVDNSSVMSCHCGEGKSPCTISHDDQTATKATTSDNEGNFSLELTEHAKVNSSKDQINSVDKDEVSAYCDQTDDFIRRLRANVAASTTSIKYNGVNNSEARCDDSFFHALIDQIDSNDYNLVNTILNDPDINQILSIKFDFLPEDDTDEALTSDSDAKEILEDVRPLQTNQGTAGEHLKQVCIAVEVIMQQCRRLELLDKGISQEAAHVSINSAVEKIVQACRQFDALDEKICRDTFSDDRESQKVTEKSCSSELHGGAARFSSILQVQKEMLPEEVLFTDVGRPPEALEKPAHVSSSAFRDDVPVSPSKISQRFNQRIEAAQLVEKLNFRKITNMSGHDELNKKGGPSNASHAKETLMPDVTLHLDVGASPKVDEIPALASPYKLIRQLALRKKVFENQKVAFFDAFRDTPASTPPLTSPQRRTSAAIITGRKLSRQRNNRAYEKKKHASTELKTETAESTVSLEKLKEKEPIVELGTFLEVNKKEQPVIISTEKSEPKFVAEKDRKGTKNGRRLSRKRVEKNSRSEKPIHANTDLKKETMETFYISEDKVLPSVELETPLEYFENPIIKVGTSMEVDENEQSLTISPEKSEPKFTADDLGTSLEVGEKEQSVNISSGKSEQKFAAEKERKGTKPGRKLSHKCGGKNSRLIERKIVESTDMLKETIEPLNKSEEKVSDKVSALVELKSSLEVCENPIIKLETSLEVGRKGLPVIISSEKTDPKATGEKERTEAKTGRKLSHKLGERNGRSVERKIVTNSDMNKETMEPLNKSKDKISVKVSQSVDLKPSLEVCERQQPASSTIAETLNETEKETGRLLNFSCSLEEREEKMLNGAIAIELRTHPHYDVAIAPSASAFSDPSAYSSPSKQNRRLERAAKMLDLRKNKHRDKRNDGGDVALSLRSESSDTIKDVPLGTSSPNLNQLYEYGANMHRDVLEKHSYIEEVMMINSSGSSNSFKHGALSIDTAVQVSSFEEAVCTTKHSNVFPTYLSGALPDPSATDTATIKVAGDVSAAEHHWLSPPRSGVTTPRSLRKIASPAAARDRMKTARRLWHTDISPKSMPIE